MWKEQGSLLPLAEAVAARLDGSIGDELNSSCQGIVAVQQPFNDACMDELHGPPTHVLAMCHTVGKAKRISGPIHANVGNQLSVEHHVSLSMAGLRQKQTDRNLPMIRAIRQGEGLGRARNLSY